MLLSPVLTMSLLAEEKHKRTDQLLLTSPVSLPGIVLGKYLAAVTVMACTVLLTLVYVLVVALYGAVYPGELMVGYLGFILQGSAFLALLAGGVTQAWLQDALSFFSLYQRYNPFLMGQLSFASIGFDLAFIAAFLALTVHSLDSRRYRGV